MRILVVSQYFWPETFRINEVVADLVRRGHHVTVLTGKPNYPDGEVFADFVKAPRAYDRYEGAEIVRLPMIPRGQGKFKLVANYLTFVASGLTIGAWRLRDKPFDAVLVCQLSPIFSAIPALLQRRLKRAPLTMWVLDLWPETLSAVGMVRSPRVLGLIGKVVSFIYNRCDCILVQSKAFIPSVRKLSDGSATLRYFPAWAEATFEAPLRSIEVAPEAAPYADTFNVVFAGNIGEAQDLPAVLDAAEKLRDRNDIRWLILGDGRAASSVRDEIARRGLQDRVVMLGRFPIERMPSFFKAAGALLVSLKAEPVFAMTVPGKVQSYMRTGVPIVAMLDGEGTRVVSEAGAGLTCAAGDSDGLARAVREIAGWPREQWERAGQAGQDYCRREFDRATLLSKLADWLTEFSRARRLPPDPVE